MPSYCDHSTRFLAQSFSSNYHYNATLLLLCKRRVVAATARGNPEKVPGQRKEEHQSWTVLVVLQYRGGSVDVCNSNQKSPVHFSRQGLNSPTLFCKCSKRTQQGLKPFSFASLISVPRPSSPRRGGELAEVTNAQPLLRWELAWPELNPKFGKSGVGPGRRRLVPAVTRQQQ